MLKHERRQFLLNQHVEDQLLCSYADLPKLGVSFHRKHLERLIKKGKFPKPVKIGYGANGRVAFRVRDIMEWINGLKAA
jgi:predicted DNA-binding transcriptional regulator AlpA